MCVRQCVDTILTIFFFLLHILTVWKYGGTKVLWQCYGSAEVVLWECIERALIVLCQGDENAFFDDAEQARLWQLEASSLCMFIVLNLHFHWCQEQQKVICFFCFCLSWPKAGNGDSLNHYGVNHFALQWWYKSKRGRNSGSLGHTRTKLWPW